MISHDTVLINGVPTLCELQDRQPYEGRDSVIEWIRYLRPEISSTYTDVDGTGVTGHTPMIKCPVCNACSQDFSPIKLSLN